MTIFNIVTISKKVGDFLFLFFFLKTTFAQTTISYSSLLNPTFQDSDIVNNFTLLPQLQTQLASLTFYACGYTYAGGASVFSQGLYNYAHLEYLNIPPHYSTSVSFSLYKSQASSNNFYFDFGTIGNSAKNYFSWVSTPYSCFSVPVYVTNVIIITDNVSPNIYIEFGMPYNSNPLITDVFGFRDFKVAFSTCIPNCLLCSDSSTCSQCDTVNNYALQPPSLSCLPCPIGTYANSSQNACSACDPTCIACSGPNANQCTNCSGIASLVNGECVIQCNSTEYLDNINRICLPCDISFQTCFSFNNSSCLSCYNGLNLSQNTCVKASNNNVSNTSNTQNNSSGVNTSNNNVSNTSNTQNNGSSSPSPAKIEQINTTLSFVSNNPFFVELDFQQNYSFINLMNLENLMSIELDDASSNRKSNVSYIIQQNPNNSLSYFILLSYQNATSPTKPFLNLTFIDPLNKSLSFFNKSYSLPINSTTFCSQSQYFDINNTKKCMNKLNLKYSLWYTDEANIIRMQYNSLTPALKHSISNEGLLVLTIDSFTPILDFNYSFTFDSDSIFVTFSFSKSVVGGKILSISMKQNIYHSFNYFEISTFLINQTSSLKLMEYYLLSNQDSLSINRTITAVTVGNLALNPLIYFNIFIKPNSLTPITGIILLKIIEMLKFLQIDYPPNLMTIFKTNSNDFFAISSFFQESISNLPPLFQYYSIKNDIFNNLGQNFMILFGCIVFTILLQVLGLLKPKKTIFVKILNFFKQRFVWNILVMMFFSRYMETCFFLFIYLKYEISGVSPNNAEITLNLFLAIFCLNFLLFFPFHIAKTCKNLVFMDFEKENEIIGRKKSVELKKNKLYPLSPISMERNGNTLEKNDGFGVFSEGFDSKNSKKLLLFGKKLEKKLIENLEGGGASELGSTKDLLVSSPLKFTKTSIFSNRNSNDFNKNDIPQEKKVVLNPRQHSAMAIFFDLNEKTSPKASIFLKKSSKFNHLEITAPTNEANNNNLNRFLTEEASPCNSEGGKSQKPDISNLKNAKKSILWQNFNEYKTPELRKPKTPEKQSNEGGLSSENIENEQTRDLNTSLVKNTSKFKELEIKCEGKIKKALDATPTIKIADVKNSNEINKNNILGIFFLKIDEIFRKMKNFYQVKDPNQYKSKYAILWKDISRKQVFWKNVLELIRLFLIPAVIIWVFGEDKVQISILNLVNLIFFSYVAIKRPFQAKISVFLRVISEFCVVISYFSAHLLGLVSKNDLTVNARLNLGFTVIFAYLFLLYFLIINTIIKLVNCNRNRKKIHKQVSLE